MKEIVTKEVEIEKYLIDQKIGAVYKDANYEID